MTTATARKPRKSRNSVHAGFVLDKLLAQINEPVATKRFDVKPPEILPRVVGDGATAAVVGDDIYAYASQVYAGAGFPGYPYLSQLATRAEFRLMASGIAGQITRKWIKLTAASTDELDAGEAAEKITQLEAELKRLRLRETISEAATHDCYFGRAQMFVDIRGADPGVPLVLAPQTIRKGSLQRLVTVEPIWTTPVAYNALNPAAPDFYRPHEWWMLGKRVHASRLLTVVTRPVPDLLKPAFNFSGMSLSQLAESYVDSWLNTKTAIGNLLRNFSITALKTHMDQVLQGDDDAQDLVKRAQLFAALRDNRGLMLLDFDSEDLVQINTPLSGLSELQAQSQEHMCSVSRIPAVIMTGLSPTGLNASSEGEIRVFYDWVASQQQAYWDEPVSIVIKLAQLNLWGEIDPRITHEWNPLTEMTDAERADIRQKQANADVAYVQQGVLDPLEVRTRLANDPASGYDGIDAGDVPEPPEPPPGLGGAGEGGEADPNAAGNPGGEAGADEGSGNGTGPA